MRRPRLLALVGALGLATVAGSAAAPAADAPAPVPAARGAALALQVSVPGQAALREAAVESRSGAASGGGAFTFPGDPRVAAVQASSAAVDATPGAAAAAAHATARVTGLSLLDGLITADEVAVEAVAEANGGGAATRLGTVVRGLAVGGRPVPDGVNRVVVIAGVGDLTVGERVDALRAEDGQRSFAIALHLRLRQAFRGLPAGTEFVVGYADAGAAMPAGAVPADDPSGPAGDGQPATVTAPQPALEELPPAPGALPELAPATAHDTDRTQSPPPGGFTRTPPIHAVVRASLLSDVYTFPVVGAAQYSDDFGAPRASTGFHQGDDLFAPNGTPLVAVHDGIVFRVGWNHLGGRRLWLDDGQGNLFYYAHLSAFSPLAQENAVVRKGDVIGFLGNSGEAETTPPHLHFEIHPGGGWAVPPYAYLRAWQGAPVALPPAPDPEDAARALAAADDATATASAVDAGTQLPGGDIGSASGLDLDALLRAARGQSAVEQVSADRSAAAEASAG